MKYIPKGIQDKIILKPITDNEQMVSGFYIPDAGQEKSQLAEILSVGKGMYNFYTERWVPSDLKPGDLVLVPKFNASSFKLNGVEYYVCKENEILSIIEKSEK